jgi:hypothetical protein
MFYTLVSRTIITKITTPRDYLYMFIIGSVGYVVLHWYLHMDKRDGIVEKVREYLYYMMVFDMVTSYVLMTLYPVKSGKPDVSDDEKDENDGKNNNTQPYTPEQRRSLLQKMQEARRLQLLRQKEMADQNAGLPSGDAEKAVNCKPEDTKANIAKQEKRETKSQEPESKTDIPTTHRVPDNKPREPESQSREPRNQSREPETKSIFTKSDESKDDDDEDEDKKEDAVKDGLREETKYIGKNKKVNIKDEIQDTEIPIFDSKNKTGKTK